MSQVHLVLYFNAISRASTPRLLARFLSLHARNFSNTFDIIISTIEIVPLLRSFHL